MPPPGRSLAASSRQQPSQPKSCRTQGQWPWGQSVVALARSQGLRPGPLRASGGMPGTWLGCLRTLDEIQGPLGGGSDGERYPRLASLFDRRPDWDVRVALRKTTHVSTGVGTPPGTRTLRHKHLDVGRADNMLNIRTALAPTMNKRDRPGWDWRHKQDIPLRIP